MIRTFAARLSKLEAFLIGLLAALALVIECAVMTTRYLIPDIALGWAEQLVIYLVVWALWLSASQLVEKQEHIHNDLLLRRLQGRWQWLAQLTNSAAGLLFCAALSWGSWAVVDFALFSGETSEGALPIPLFLYYLSMTAGTLLMCSKYLLIISDRWQAKS